VDGVRLLASALSNVLTFFGFVLVRWDFEGGAKSWHAQVGQAGLD
jgi:hypothetical protein